MPMREFGRGIGDQIVKYLQDLDAAGENLPPIVLAAPTQTEELVGRAITAVSNHLPIGINVAVTGTAAKTFGFSIIGASTCNDQLAKTFYVAAAVCSASSMGFSGAAAIEKACSISVPGVTSEAIAESFYRAGEKARKMAEERAANIIKPPLLLQHPDFSHVQ